MDKSLDELWLDNPFEFERQDKPVNLSMFERNRLFFNSGDGVLIDGSHISGVDIDSDSRAVSIGDLNEDGRPDLIVRNAGGGPLRVFMNRGRRNRALRITLRGTRSNSNGIGARLTLEVGNRRLYREHFPQNNVFAQCANETIFGLGTYEGPLTLTIKWPSGAVQVIDDLAPGHREITEADRARKG